MQNSLMAAVAQAAGLFEEPELAAPKPAGNDPLALEYLAKLKAHGHEAVDAAIIHQLAADWQASQDIRDEFRTFDCFAAFSRARAAGRARICGQR